MRSTDVDLILLGVGGYDYRRTGDQLEEIVLRGLQVHKSSRESYVCLVLEWMMMACRQDDGRMRLHVHVQLYAFFRVEDTGCL